MAIESPEESLTPEKFQELLPLICDGMTTQSPDRWSRRNPLLGHCAVVSTVAQSIFGGKLLRASLLEVPEFAYARSHYINEFPNGEKMDFTKPQFEGKYPSLIFEEKSRDYVLSYPETAARFRLLSSRLAKVVTRNPLFDDVIYEECFDQALRSPCQKGRFGALLVRDDWIVAKATNEKIDELKSMCDPTCIRLGISSRTESMLGACGHAEEWVMSKARDAGVNLKDCDLYVAGVKMNGFPWFKREAEHTCLRCAVQMNFAGLKTIRVPVIDHWADLSPSEALSTASLYATGMRKV
jgi:deoxycytidylate deaminase